MPERASHTETLRAGAPIRVGSVTLLPIERIAVHADGSALRIWSYAAKEPYALVVRDAGGVWAVDAHASAISLAELSKRVPGLDALLASI